MTELIARERIERLRQEAERHRLTRTLRRGSDPRPLRLRLADRIGSRRVNRDGLARVPSVDLRDRPEAAHGCEPTTEDVPVGAR